MLEMLKNKKNLKWLVLMPVLITATVLYSCTGLNEEEVQVMAGTGGETEPSDIETIGGEDENAEEGEEAAEVKKDIFVDIGGAVEMPGVVRIAEGSRVFEAIEAAGGKTGDAEIKYMNLAAVCEDGQKIYVPTTEEVQAELDGAGSSQSGVKSGSVGSGNTGGTGLAGGLSSGSVSSSGILSITGSSSGNDQQAKVNINTATSEELQTLNGIGPSMASRIIEYREANGNFASVEDLTNVSGIGEKTLAKLIDYICV